MDQVFLSPIGITQLKELVHNSVLEALGASQVNGKIVADEFITIKEAAKLLKVSSMSIHNWMKKDLIPYYRISSHILFKRNELLEAAYAIPSNKKKLKN